MIAAKPNGSGYPIYVQIPRIKVPVPLFVVFRALGVVSDKAICEDIYYLLIFRVIIVIQYFYYYYYYTIII